MATEISFQNYLYRRRFCLLDGAFGTIATGKSTLDENNDDNKVYLLDEQDPLWGCRLLLGSMERVRDIHYAYLANGAQIITTGTYQVSMLTMIRRAKWLESIEKNDKSVKEDKFEGATIMDSLLSNDSYANVYYEAAIDLFLRGIEAAMAARTLYQTTVLNNNNNEEEMPWIAISLGPLGAMLGNGAEYRGDYAAQHITSAHLMAFHRYQLNMALKAVYKCHLTRYVIAWETIPALEEAQAIIAVLDEHDPLSCWISFSCRDTSSASDGTPIETCIETVAAHPSVVAVGVNCVPRDWLRNLVTKVSNTSSKPIIAYANGRAWQSESNNWMEDSESNNWLDESKDESIQLFCQTNVDLLSQTDQHHHLILGGCCMADPDYTKALSNMLKNNNTITE